MYKKALQAKLRFAFRGSLTVEDLFDLGLEDLNAIYKGLVQEKGDSVAGLLTEPTKEGELVALKMQVVKDVFDTKKAEIAASKAAADRKAQKARIMEIIADKQDEDLKGKSLDELTAMVEAL